MTIRRWQKRYLKPIRLFSLEGRYLFYCSTPPNLYESIAERLKSAGLLDDHKGSTSFRRLVVEKPFGYSLETAKAINEGLHRYFKEEQIFRIDHYLGKETVQNLLVTRFSNSIFEPLWNSKYIERVEITNAEAMVLPSEVVITITLEHFAICFRIIFYN